MCPLAKLPGWPTPASDEQARVTAIRSCVLHSRSQSTSQIVERLRSARMTVTAEQVEDALLGAAGVVLTAEGRWQRA